MRKIALVGAMMLAAVGVVGVASAEQKFDSKVTLHYESAGPAHGLHVFDGEVTSEKAKCVPKREVVLYRKNSAHGNSFKVGSAVTDENGFYLIATSSIESPIYYAKVKSKEIKAGLCKSDRSKRVEFN